MTYLILLLLFLFNEAAPVQELSPLKNTMITQRDTSLESFFATKILTQFLQTSKTDLVTYVVGCGNNTILTMEELAQNFYGSQAYTILIQSANVGVDWTACNASIILPSVLTCFEYLSMLCIYHSKLALDQTRSTVSVRTDPLAFNYLSSGNQNAFSIYDGKVQFYERLYDLNWEWKREITNLFENYDLAFFYLTSSSDCLRQRSLQIQIIDNYGLKFYNPSYYIHSGNAVVYNLSSPSSVSVLKISSSEDDDCSGSSGVFTMQIAQFPHAMSIFWEIKQTLTTYPNKLGLIFNPSYQQANEQVYQIFSPQQQQSTITRGDSGTWKNISLTDNLYASIFIGNGANTIAMITLQTKNLWLNNSEPIFLTTFNNYYFVDLTVSSSYLNQSPTPIIYRFISANTMQILDITRTKMFKYENVLLSAISLSSTDDDEDDDEATYWTKQPAEQNGYFFLQTYSGSSCLVVVDSLYLSVGSCNLFLPNYLFQEMN